MGGDTNPRVLTPPPSRRRARSRPGHEGYPARRRQEDEPLHNTSKLGFVFTYLLSAAGMMGVMSYLLSDKPPEGLDWLFPRIGGENPDGSPPDFHCYGSLTARTCGSWLTIAFFLHSSVAAVGIRSVHGRFYFNPKLKACFPFLAARGQSVS